MRRYDLFFLGMTHCGVTLSLGFIVTYRPESTVFHPMAGGLGSWYRLRHLPRYAYTYCPVRDTHNSQRDIDPVSVERPNQPRSCCLILKCLV